MPNYRPMGMKPFSYGVIRKMIKRQNNKRSKARLNNRKRLPKGTNYKYTPTYPSNSTAKSAVLVKRPIFGKSSQLIRDQLYYDYELNFTNSVIGLPTGYFYQANGLTDPYVPLGGHQPIGFDQMMLLFEHYAVIRCRITVTFMNNANTHVKCGITLLPDVVFPTGLTTLIENGLTKFGTLGTTDRNLLTLSMDCDIKKYFAKQKYHDILDDEKLTGNTSANPVEGVYFLLWAATTDGDGTSDVSADIVLSYDSIYFEPKPLAMS